MLVPPFDIFGRGSRQWVALHIHYTSERIDNQGEGQRYTTIQRWTLAAVYATTGVACLIKRKRKFLKSKSGTRPLPMPATNTEANACVASATASRQALTTIAWGKVGLGHLARTLRLAFMISCVIVFTTLIHQRSNFCFQIGRESLETRQNTGRHRGRCIKQVPYSNFKMLC